MRNLLLLSVIIGSGAFLFLDTDLPSFANVTELGQGILSEAKKFHASRRYKTLQATVFNLQDDLEKKQNKGLDPKEEVKLQQQITELKTELETFYQENAAAQDAQATPAEKELRTVITKLEKELIKRKQSPIPQDQKNLKGITQEVQEKLEVFYLEQANNSVTKKPQLLATVEQLKKEIKTQSKNLNEEVLQTLVADLKIELEQKKNEGLAKIGEARNRAGRIQQAIQAIRGAINQLNQATENFNKSIQEATAPLE